MKDTSVVNGWLDEDTSVLNNNDQNMSFVNNENSSCKNMNKNMNSNNTELLTNINIPTDLNKAKKDILDDLESNLSKSKNNPIGGIVESNLSKSKDNPIGGIVGSNSSKSKDNPIGGIVEESNSSKSKDNPIGCIVQSNMFKSKNNLIGVNVESTLSKSKNNPIGGNAESNSSKSKVASNLPESKNNTIVTENPSTLISQTQKIKNVPNDIKNMLNMVEHTVNGKDILLGTNSDVSLTVKPKLLNEINNKSELKTNIGISNTINNCLESKSSISSLNGLRFSSSVTITSAASNSERRVLENNENSVNEIECERKKVGNTNANEVVDVKALLSNISSKTVEVSSNSFCSSKNLKQSPIALLTKSSSCKADVNPCAENTSELPLDRTPLSLIPLEKNEIESSHSKPINKIKEQSGSKRQFEDEEDGPEQTTSKKIKLSQNKEKKNLNDTKDNEKYFKALEDGLHASQMFNPNQNDKVTNPNKLYQGLLNDVLADEKDMYKEPEAVRSKLKRIKRKDLEDMIIDQLVNKILYDHELGYQKELCKRLEQTLEVANKKALRLTQEVESLKNITLKVSMEHKKRKKFLVHPTKVKRSVGIQANKAFISQGFSTAFLPDSDVRLVTPSKYQRGSRGADLDMKGLLDEERHIVEEVGGDGGVIIKQEVVEEGEEEDEYLSLRNVLDQKLNTLRDDLRNSSLKGDLCAADKGTTTTTANGRGTRSKSKKTKKPLNNGKTPHSHHNHREAGKKGGSQSAGKTSGEDLSSAVVVRHPAPFPFLPDMTSKAGRAPPVPNLRVHLRNKSIILSWHLGGCSPDVESSVLSYHLFSYEETSEPPSPLAWQKIGSVKALELPMACTLTQFKCGRVYHFAVRAVSKKGRLGPFSMPKSLRMPLK